MIEQVTIDLIAVLVPDSRTSYYSAAAVVAEDFVTNYQRALQSIAAAVSAEIVLRLQT